MIRHGQTDWNVQKKVMGRCDEPLNDDGLKQAEETRNALLTTDIDLIICSPLKRAIQIAEIINKDRNIPIKYDKELLRETLENLRVWEYKILIFTGTGIIIKMSDTKMLKTFKSSLKEYIIF